MESRVKETLSIEHEQYADAKCLLPVLKCFHYSGHDNWCVHPSRRSICEALKGKELRHRHGPHTLSGGDVAHWRQQGVVQSML